MKRYFSLLAVLAVTGMLTLAVGMPASAAATSSAKLASAQQVPLPLCEAAKGCRVVPGSPAARRDAAQAVPNLTTEGPYNIGAYNTNYYMDAEHQDVPTRVWVYPFNGGAAQRWWDTCCYTMKDSHGFEVTGGALYANYKGYAMCLNVSRYSYVQTTPLLAYPCSNGYSLSENELFYFPNVGVTVSYYEICPVDSAAINNNLCANVSGGIASQHYLILWNAAGTPHNMQFRFYSA